MKRKMLEVSKGVGILVVVLAMLLPPAAVYTAVTVVMVAMTIRISGTYYVRLGQVGGDKKG
jgi:hypothetical protein